MSENADVPAKPKKSLFKIILIVLSIVILLLVYGAGVVLFPIKILTSYRDRNCDSVLSLNRIYMTIYPKFLEDASINVQVAECDAYASAVTSEQNEMWTNAYDAYRSYSSKYPGGLYAKDAYEHSASVLIHVIEDQVEEKKYEGAITNLNKIISDYSDTDASADAWTLTPSVYTSWGTDLRESGDFESSERVLNEFKSWSEHYQRNDVVPEAKRELAETYIAWGTALQSGGKFEDAITKFELAMKSDPAVESKAAQRKTYIEWGNALLEQKEFAAAVEKIKLAVAQSDGGNEDGVKDALSNGYVQWADGLTAEDDYLGALEQLELAKESAFTEETKQVVETAFSETYVAFSNSTGTQARQAMKEALKAVCEQKRKPDLPIFGLNKDSVRVVVYGAEASLPDTLAAKTPGELHYVACVDLQKGIIDSRNHIYIIKRTSNGYYWVGVQQHRVRVLWDIHLMKMDTLKEAANRNFPGGTPPPYPEEWGDVGGGYYEGPPPTMAELVAWLQSVVK